MKKFIKLRHLEIKGTSALNYLPEGIGALSSLRTLSKFIVGDDRGCKIEELKDLNRLEGDLEIVNLERLARGNDGSKASIEKKQYINVLSLCCVDRTDDEWSMVGEDEKEQMRDVFGSLRPHENLKELRICNYIGFGLPIWVGDASFHNLVSVQLVNCHLCRQLPPLGYLPSLKYLEIDGIRELQYVGHMHYGVPFVGPKGFPALEDLTFKRMQRWETWELSVSEEQMPCLLQLTILGCPRLEAIPDELGQLRALESLTIWQCTQLKSLPKSLHRLTTLRRLIIDECPFLKERCRKETGGDWGKIVHVPNICIDGEQIQ
ncbi:putative disease resistance protein RGA1 [Magnolia sinica]|uniref:putative disease resistance protein RGA1 n=1 Tax=Magnolia sinica TaxID=86752 RepID=UPI002658DDF3|nr:putative disease resistance protein RGA1 [Magnolia sinica]